MLVVGPGVGFGLRPNTTPRRGGEQASSRDDVNVNRQADRSSGASGSNTKAKAKPVFRTRHRECLLVVATLAVGAPGVLVFGGCGGGGHTAHDLLSCWRCCVRCLLPPCPLLTRTTGGDLRGCVCWPPHCVLSMQGKRTQPLLCISRVCCNLVPKLLHLLSSSLLLGPHSPPHHNHSKPSPPQQET